MLAETDVRDYITPIDLKIQKLIVIDFIVISQTAKKEILIY